MDMSLTCASDAYKFNLLAAVVAQGGEVTGSWSETSRNVGGNIQGRGANGSFQVVAQAAGFSSSISLKTTGNKQQICHEGRQPVPRGQYFAVEVARLHPQAVIQYAAPAIADIVGTIDQCSRSAQLRRGR